jgi:hypothetical protein
VPYTNGAKPTSQSPIHKSPTLYSILGQKIRVKISTPYIRQICINVTPYLLVSSMWCCHIAWLDLLQHAWLAPPILTSLILSSLCYWNTVICEIYLTSCMSQCYSFSEWDAGILRIRKKFCLKIMENNLCFLISILLSYYYYYYYYY